MFCPKCGSSLDEGRCVECGFEVVEKEMEVLVAGKQEVVTQKSSWLPKLFAWIGVGLTMLGLIFILVGFDKKNNYSYDRNEYVGGDAYNFIINGTYFTGYMVLGAACFVCATPLFCVSALVRRTDALYESERE